eukprot:gene8235-60_t
MINWLTSVLFLLLITKSFGLTCITRKDTRIEWQVSQVPSKFPPPKTPSRLIYQIPPTTNIISLTVNTLGIKKSSWSSVSFQTEQNINSSLLIFFQFRDSNLLKGGILNNHHERIFNENIPKRLLYFDNTQPNATEQLLYQLTPRLANRVNYISVAYSSIPIVNITNFPRHDYLAITKWNVNQTANSCSSFDYLRFASVGVETLYLEEGFYILLFLILIYLRNEQPLKSRSIFPPIAVIIQYLLSLAPLQRYYIDAKTATQYECYFTSLVYLNLLCLIGLLVPLNYLHKIRKDRHGIFYKIIVILGKLSSPYISKKLRQFPKTFYQHIIHYLFFRDPFYFRVEFIVGMLVSFSYFSGFLIKLIGNSVARNGRDLNNTNIISSIFITIYQYGLLIYQILLVFFWAFDSLDEIMKNKDLKKQFREFAVVEWSLENYLCYEDILKYNNTKSKWKKKEIGCDIFYTYFNGDKSTLRINCPGRVANKLKSKFDYRGGNVVEFDDDLFDDAFNEVKTNLSDTYARFIDSPEYENYIKNQEFVDHELKSTFSIRFFKPKEHQ